MKSITHRIKLKIIFIMNTFPSPHLSLFESSKSMDCQSLLNNHHLYLKLSSVCQQSLLSAQPISTKRLTFNSYFFNSSTFSSNIGFSQKMLGFLCSDWFAWLVQGLEIWQMKTIKLIEYFEYLILSLASYYDYDKYFS